MDESWAYLGLSTKGEDVTIGAARPRWDLAVKGRKPRGEWCPTVEWLERLPRADLGGWLLRKVADSREPVWTSPRLTLLVDIGRYGEGDLVRSALERAFDRWVGLRQRLRPHLIEVTDRDVLRSQRPDGILTLPRREVLASLSSSVEAEHFDIQKGPLVKEFLDQFEAIRRRPEPEAGTAGEDLVRAVALTVWALHREGAGRLRGFTETAPLCVH